MVYRCRVSKGSSSLSSYLFHYLFFNSFFNQSFVKLNNDDIFLFAFSAVIFFLYFTMIKSSPGEKCLDESERVKEVILNFLKSFFDQSANGLTNRRE